MKKYPILPLLLVIIAVPLIVKNINFDLLKDSFKQVAWLWLVGGLPLLILGIWLKGWRWEMILKDKLGSIYLSFVLMVGYLLNNILPARLGEVVRVYLVVKQKGVGLKKIIKSLLVEKLLDVFCLGSGLLCLLGFAPNIKNNLIIPFGGITNFPNKLKQFFNYLVTRYSKWEIVKIVSISLIIWSIEIGWTYFLTRSFGLNFDLLILLSLVVFVNLSFVLPAPPANLVIYEFAVVMVLTFWGVDKTTALAYAIFQHMAEYVLLSLLGIIASIKVAYNPLANSDWKSFRKFI